MQLSFLLQSLCNQGSSLHSGTATSVSRRVFVALLLCLLTWGGYWTLGNRERLLALQAVHHTKYSFRPPAERASQLQRFDLALQALQKKSPALLEVKREYLGQPFEETQGLFFTMAQVALRDRNLKEWKLVVELLEGMALSERNSEDLSAEKLQVLHRLEQRTNAIYAQAKMMRVPFERFPRDEFTGNRSLCHRLLIAERVRKWSAIQERGRSLWNRGSGGYFVWSEARRQMQQFDAWHDQLDRGQVLNPNGELKAVYEVLLLFSEP